MDQRTPSRQPPYLPLLSPVSVNSLYQGSSTSISVTSNPPNNSTSAAASSSAFHERASSSTFSGPLPSPVATEVPQSFFGSLDQQAAVAAAQQQAYYQNQQQQLQQQATQEPYQQQYQRQRAGSYSAACQYQYPYPYQPQGAASAQETAGYMREYALVAEAARRAQVAVLVRDMELVELSKA